MRRNSCMVDWKYVTMHPHAPGTTGTPLRARPKFIFLRGHCEEVEYIEKMNISGIKIKLIKQDYAV